MDTISNEAKIARQDAITQILSLDLFDREATCPDWASWTVTGLRKGLAEVQQEKAQEVDHGFLMKCLEAVLLAKNSEITHGKDQDGAFADNCGKVLSAIAHYDLGQVHSTQTMEKKYAVRAKAAVNRS